MKHSFRNDYSSLAHPRIMEALAKNSLDQNIAYGLDIHSDNATKLIKKAFNCPTAQVYFLAGGTQTNMVMISSILRPYEGVISCETGHINVHETAAIEGSGHKIITVKGKDGKVYPEDIESVMHHFSDEHMVKPGMVYISDSTEIGTIYSKDELKALRKLCDKYNLYLYLDGARIASALTSKYNDVTPDIISETCDAFYVGGTKNGLMYGEALVIVNQDLAKDFRYVIKNKGAMLAKGYGVGLQFEEAFKDNFYFNLGKSTNEVADYLKEGLTNLGITINDSPTNQVFVKFDAKTAQKIIDEYQAEVWEKSDDGITIRLVVSFTTKKDDVDDLIAFIKKVIS